MQHALLFFAFALSSCQSGLFSSKKPDEPQAKFKYDCESDREFMTTYEYLRRNEHFGLSPLDMQAVALRVADGCTDAAAAFVDITEMLLKAQIDGPTSIKTARDIASKGKVTSEAFIGVFRGAYAKDIFDLSSGDSLRLAKRFSVEYTGDTNLISNDFKELSNFCRSEMGSGLSRVQCAKVIERILIAGEESRKPVGKTFVEAFTFLTNQKETNLTAQDALSIAEQISAASPKALDNFKNAYEYALDKSGLNLSRKEAILLATSVALKTRQPNPEHQPKI
ncbi:MAG: hypothetical protein NT027_12795 [Proteobacteria bacterium]|nr:hypothetical protein [Pseudomonadota bacterium]